MTGTTSIHLYDDDEEEELVQFYSDVVPRVGNRVAYEMPRAKQVSGGIATVEGEVDAVSITYRENSTLIQVRLLDTTIEYVS